MFACLHGRSVMYGFNNNNKIFDAGTFVCCKQEDSKCKFWSKRKILQCNQ